MAFLYDALTRSAVQAAASRAFEIIGGSGHCWSFEDLKTDVDEVANRLSEKVGHRDIVGIVSSQLETQFLLTLALDKLNIATTALLTDAANLPRWVSKTVDFQDQDPTSGSFQVNVQHLSALTMPPHAKADDRLSRIVFTSGTTGHPKGVAFSPQIIANRVEEYERNLGGLFDAGPELLCLMGLPSSLGYLSLCHTLHYGRNYVVLDSSGPFPNDQSGRRFGVVSSTPATLAEYWAMGKAGRELPFSVTNMIVSGGSIANSFCDQITDLFNASLYSLFGSTETGLVAFAPTSALDLDTGEVGLMRNSCRLAENRDETKSVRFETDFVAPYVNDTILSSGTVTPLQSWSSNDRCEILDTGILKFSGRASETVNSGGVKMALSEIENAAIAFPNVHQACALLQPDALGIERVILVLKSDQDLDRSAFAKHYRSLFPEPLFPIRFFELDEVPKTASGKIDRFKLKRFILKNL